jgi:hypothetical protein
MVHEGKEKPLVTEAAKATDTRSQSRKSKGGTLAKRNEPINLRGLEEIPWNDDKVVGPLDYYEGFGRHALTIEKADELLNQCCANCFELNTVHDKVFWFSQKEYVCEPCADLPVIQQAIDVKNAYLGKLKTISA